MIKALTDLPAGLIGFEIDGKVEAQDYRDVVTPLLEGAAARGEVRCVIVIPKFEGMSAGAVGQDLKVGVEHWRGWKRIAIVSDIDWVQHVTQLFGWMTPGEVRTFAAGDRDQAVTWAAG